jgi:hypothetical protein
MIVMCRRWPLLFARFTHRARPAFFEDDNTRPYARVAHHRYGASIGLASARYVQVPN